MQLAQPLVAALPVWTARLTSHERRAARDVPKPTVAGDDAIAAFFAGATRRVASVGLGPTGARVTFAFDRAIDLPSRASVFSMIAHADDALHAFDIFEALLVLFNRDQPATLNARVFAAHGCDVLMHTGVLDAVYGPSLTDEGHVAPRVVRVYFHADVDPGPHAQRFMRTLLGAIDRGVE